MGEGRDHHHRRNKICGLGRSALLEKYKDSQLGVPRRQVAYKPVSHQAVKEHSQDSLQDSRSAGALQGGSVAFQYIWLATAHASFTMAPHLTSAFLSAGLPAHTAPRLPGHLPPYHCLVLSFSNNPALSDGHIPSPSPHVPSFQVKHYSPLSRGLSHICGSLIQSPPCNHPFISPMDLQITSPVCFVHCCIPKI